MRRCNTFGRDNGVTLDTRRTFFPKFKASLTTATVVNKVSELLTPDRDKENKKVWCKKRQADAMEWAEKESDSQLEKARDNTVREDEQQRERDRLTKYKRSMKAFEGSQPKLTRSYVGSASNRVIGPWEDIYYNHIRYIWTGQWLIAKDRNGVRFFTRYNSLRPWNEDRLSFRPQKDRWHQPYGVFPNDHPLWSGWNRHHRAEPPSIKEEEYLRTFKKDYIGPHVIGNEEVEDAVVRQIVSYHRADMLHEMNEKDEFGELIRKQRPQRSVENSPDEEMANRKSGTTWNVAFVKGEVFYNEQDTQNMRTELGHMYRQMEWQDLEYKRQIQKRKQPWPINKPKANGSPGEPMNESWERMDGGIPHHDAVPDLTTPELERLRIESDQLEDERLATRKELGLTDLGDIRDGRDPIDKGYAPFQPRPSSETFAPKCWSESWGTGGGHKW